MYANLKIYVPSTLGDAPLCPENWCVARLLWTDRPKRERKTVTGNSRARSVTAGGNAGGSDPSNSQVFLRMGGMTWEADSFNGMGGKSGPGGESEDDDGWAFNSGAPDEVAAATPCSRRRQLLICLLPPPHTLFSFGLPLRPAWIRLLSSAPSVRISSVSNVSVVARFSIHSELNVKPLSSLLASLSPLSSLSLCLSCRHDVMRGRERESHSLTSL